MIGDDREKTISGADYAYEADFAGTAADPLVQAWLTLKPYPEGINAADPGSLQKIVTTSLVAGVGQITADGAATGGAATILFLLTAVNTTGLGQRDYVFDVKVKTAAGFEYPAARGLWSNSGATTLST